MPDDGRVEDDPPLRDQGLKIGGLVSACIATVLAYLLIGCCAHAQAVDNFALGGLNWKIPKDHIVAEALSGPAPHAVSLQFALPDFGPVNENDFKDVPPESARPILSVTITDDTHEIVGQPLLDQIMSTAEVDCSTCIADSSLGGKVYSNYAKLNYHDMKNGAPYNLYVNKTATGNWFTVCYFRQDITPLPCEIRERYGKTLTVIYKFPQEYISQAFIIGAELRTALTKYQNPAGIPSPEDVLLARPQPTCWSPTPGTLDALTIPLQVGPELWHIPQAYAATFGLDQTQNAKVNGFIVYLKLPNLMPLSETDPSPFEIHGSGQYMYIFFTYDEQRAPGSKGFKADGNGGTVPRKEFLSYIGQSAFINYKEFLQIVVGPGAYITNDSAVTLSSFPPRFFRCDQFTPGESAGCQISVHEPSYKDTASNPFGEDVIYYHFSSDYFSQLKPISQCVEHLYNMFTSSTSK